MSAQGSTHSCCEDDAPISVSPTPPPVSVSPASLDLLLRDVPNLDVSTLRGILGGAIGTMRQNQEAHDREKMRLRAQVETLERRIEHYEIQHPECPQGYENNVGRAPSFYIPGLNRTTVLAKWVKQLDDGRVAGFGQHQAEGEAPHVIELFLTPFYDIEDPPEPLPRWFRTLLMGLSALFNVLREEVARLDDWSALAEVVRHRALCDQLCKKRHQIKILDAQIDGLVERRRLCEARLETGKVSAQVKYLEHLAPRAPQLGKRQGSKEEAFQAGRGRPA
jgi:hypothetical protein